MTSILLADDHHVVRRGLRALLEAEPGFSVIGEAGDGLQAVQMVENLRPDVMVTDLMMGGINGIEVTRQTCKCSPRTGVIVLTMYGNESYVLEALRAGARAYVLKESPPEELVRAVHKVAAGHRYLGPPLCDQAIEAYMQRAEGTKIDPYDTLTSREREVLHLIVQEHTNVEIAKRLFISQRTVEVHRANMMNKLGLRTQAQLLRYAVKRGILPPDQ